MLARKLAAAAGLAMIAVGAGGVLAPEASSRGYGIPVADAAAVAYLRAAAARDVAIGAMLVAAARKGKKKALRAALLGAAVIPIADLAVVAASTKDARKLAVHAAGLVGILAVWTLAAREC